MNQSQMNDPRTWGKVAMSGGVSAKTLSDAAFNHLWVAEIATSKLAKGQTVCRPKGSRGFKSLRKVRAEHIYQLGQQILGMN